MRPAGTGGAWLHARTAAHASYRLVLLRRNSLGNFTWKKRELRKSSSEIGFDMRRDFRSVYSNFAGG